MRALGRGKCGAECETCPYFKNPCAGCTIETCLVADCMKGRTYSGLTHPKSFCTMRQYCPIGGKNRPPPASHNNGFLAADG